MTTSLDSDGAHERMLGPAVPRRNGARMSPRKRKHAKAMVCVIGLALAVTAGIASAATKSVSDAKGDARKPVFDLRSVDVSAGGKVTFTIQTWNAAIGKDPLLLAVDMRVGTKRYVAGWNGTDYGVHTGSNGQTAGKLTVTRKSSRKVVLSFASRALGGATSFRWRVIAGQGCESCPASDTAPNKGYVTQRIG